MPKRIIDGEGLWRSDKLAQVDPVSYRAEYANLIPLALANGVFECTAKRIWSMVYSYNRPDISEETVESMLAEFERVKLLFRWPAEGKVWGFWVGIEKPGRLPGKSRWGTNEAIGPMPPEDFLRKFLDSNGIHSRHNEINGFQMFPNGIQMFPGSGFGLGLGLGSGSCSGTESIARAPSALVPAPPAQISYDPEVDGSELFRQACDGYIPGMFTGGHEESNRFMEACEYERVNPRKGLHDGFPTSQASALWIIERIRLHARVLQARDKGRIPYFRNFLKNKDYALEPVEASSNGRESRTEAAKAARAAVFGV